MARSSQQPVKHESAIVLLLIDFINDLEFTGGDELVRYALPAARSVARLKAAAKQRNVPCLYVNDNFEQWRSNFKLLVNSCVNGRVRGTPVAKLLTPDRDDYFVLKPMHSGFFQTPLELLVMQLKAKRLVLCGLTTDSCVLFTANDAYLRRFELVIPSDCSAALTPQRHQTALGQMRRTLHAKTPLAKDIDFNALAHAPARE
jgi:nicotinamidase-related amidase